MVLDPDKSLTKGRKTRIKGHFDKKGTQQISSSILQHQRNTLYRVNLMVIYIVLYYNYKLESV